MNILCVPMGFVCVFACVLFLQLFLWFCFILVYLFYETEKEVVELGGQGGGKDVGEMREGNHNQNILNGKYFQ